MTTRCVRKGEEAANMERAATEARKEERRMVVNFLYSFNAPELAERIAAGEHTDELDPR